MLRRDAKTKSGLVNTRGARSVKRQVARDRIVIERAFRRLLDGVEREPAIADLLSPRGDEGWH